MPAPDFIDVQVLIDGVEAPEYVRPKGSRDAEHFKSRYVEGKAGQTLAVRVTLEPGFNFHDSSHVHCELKLDDQKTWFILSIAKVDCMVQQNLLNQKAKTTFQTVYQRDSISGHWEIVTLLLSPLEKVQDVQLAKFADEALNKLGKVRLAVYRGLVKPLPEPRPRPSTSASTDKVPECLMKGREPKSIIGFGSRGTACGAPPLQLVENVPMCGDKGQKYIFEFDYRERNTLKMIGCDVRSLTPEAELDNIRDSRASTLVQNSDETFEMLKRQNMRLQKQIDSMNWQSKLGDGRKRIKIEDSDADEDEDRKSMPPLKRQKFDELGIDQKPIVDLKPVIDQKSVIDLTGDSD